MSDSAVRSRADEEWEDLMGQLRAQAKGRPAGFFYPRVRARLEARAAPGRRTELTWLRRPAYAVLLATMMLLLSGDGSALPAAKGSYPETSHGLQPGLLPR